MNTIGLIGAMDEEVAILKEQPALPVEQVIKLALKRL